MWPASNTSQEGKLLVVKLSTSLLAIDSPGEDLGVDNTLFARPLKVSDPSSHFQASCK